MRVAVIFGGQSAEHEVSLLSARSVIAAMDPERYQAVPVGIDKRGRWFLLPPEGFLESPEDVRRVRLRTGVGREIPAVALARGEDRPWLGEDVGALDVVFPLVHGPTGEDGTLQGLLSFTGVPFVGSGVTASAVAMDKDAANRLFRDAGIPQARFLTVGVPRSATGERGRGHGGPFEQGEGAGRPGGSGDHLDWPDYDEVAARLGSVLFVKPACLGSSVGVSRVSSAREFVPALERAFRYDTKVVIEEGIAGREIECSVLGNEAPRASVPGEVIPTGGHGFYSYEAKYVDPSGARLLIPAPLEEETVRRVQELAIRSFQVLGCEGMARVDFFLRPDGELLVNEVNSIPGFTRISMYPKLWEASGLAYGALIDRLVELALRRTERRSRLRMNVQRDVEGQE